MTESHVLVGHGDHKVICLHGWFGSATGWGHWPELLDGERFAYAFVDCRGYGARKDEPGEHTMAEISADVLALANDLGWQTFDLVGHSMGGKAVQRVLCDAPDRVRKVVGISPVAASPSPFDEQGWTLFSSAAQDDESRAAIVDFTTGNRLTRTWIDQIVAHSVDRSTREAFADYLLAWAREDFVADVRGLEHPVLAIVGEHDPALGEEATRATLLEHYPNCSLEVVPNAGHYAMFETPVALATMVEAFLAAQ